MFLFLRKFLPTSLVLALFPIFLFAQVPTPLIGTPPFGSFGGGPDIVNLSTLNASLTIPIVHKAGRSIPFKADLNFNTSIWQALSQTWQPVGGFGLSFSGPIGFVTFSEENITCGARTPQRLFTDWTYVDPSGTAHPFGIATRGATAGCPATTATATAVEGSGYTISVTGSSVNFVTAPDGSVIHPPEGLSNLASGSIQDSNGNQITLSSGNFTDTLSKTVLTVAGSGTPSSPTTFTYTAPSGASVSYTVKYTALNVKTNFGCNGITDFPATSENLVSEIDLPDGSKYSFVYEPTPNFSGDVTGRVASVTLPTGGKISYTYPGPNGGVNCTLGVATGLTRTTPDGTWTYARSFGTAPASTTTVTAPKLPYDSGANVTVIQFQGIYETQRQVFQGSTSGTLLRTVNTCYNTATIPCTGTAITLPITQRVVQDQLGGTSAPICQHTFKYNSFGLLTEQDDTDYGSSTAPGALLRKQIINYASLGNNIVNQPSSITICNGTGSATACNSAGTVIAQTTFSYDQSSPTGTSGTPQHGSISGSRGNPTTISRLVAGSTTLNQTFSYFNTGTVQTATDVNGAQTTFAYADCGNSFPTSISEPLSMSRSMTWNCNGGVLATSTDENSQPTSTDWTDSDFWRPADVKFPDTGETSFAYNSQTSTTVTQKMNSSQNIVGIAQLDGLSRAIHNQLCEDGTPSCTQPITTDTAYDVVGRVASVSNPHRSGASSTDGSTSTQYDALGRPTSVTLQDGSSKSIASYSNNTVTATDPAGKKRQSTFDSLGRLTQVTEDPGGLGFVTTYGYDTLGNLTSVVQNGSRNRTLAYDGLSRLTSETNPETGTITYKYDADSNCASPNSSSGDLISRTDARSIRTCYQYDALHRLTAKNYSDGTPTATFNYDQTSALGVTLTNTIGRLSSVSTAGSNPTGSVFSYDSVGRILNNSQCTPVNCGGAPFPLQYTYDLAGDLLTYTNGVVLNSANVTFTQGFDTAGRVTQLSSSLSDAQHPATLAAVDGTLGYSPIGGIPKLALGNGLTASWAYNNSLEFCHYNTNSSSTALSTCGSAAPSGSVQDFTFGFPSGANNGNVASMMAMGTTATQNFNRTYGYDALNRLATMSDSNTSQTCRGLSWTYDAWGNRTAQNVTAGTCGTFSATIDANNRLSGSPYSYDAAGNLLTDGNHTYFYDAENRLIQVDGSSGFCATGSGTAAAMCYLYDALGQRVRKFNGSTIRDYVFNLTSNVVAEIEPTNSWQVGYNYFAGQLQSEYRNSSTYFVHSDHLGSVHLLTAMDQSIFQSYDFLPFGELASSTGTGTNTHRFVGMERDPVDNLDHTLFRQYSSQLGRWSSPDPAGLAAADPGYPQSLNRYTYVLDNPLALVDPLGLDCVTITSILLCTVNVPNGGNGGDSGPTAGTPSYFTLGGTPDFSDSGGSSTPPPCREAQRGSFPGLDQNCGNAPRFGPSLSTVSRNLNKCAAQLAATKSVSALSNGRIPEFLGSNFFSDISKLATGNGGVDQAAGLATEGTIQVAEHAGTQAVVGTVATIATPVSATEGVYNPISAGTASQSFGGTLIGRVGLGFLKAASIAKIGYDAAIYLAAEAACAAPTFTTP